jgi:hypothetical protein
LGGHNVPMNLAVPEFLVLLPVLAWVALWLWTLSDAWRYSDETWRVAGESRTMWLLLILVLQFFGILFYLVWIRPKLTAVGAGQGATQ